MANSPFSGGGFFGKPVKMAPGAAPQIGAAPAPAQKPAAPAAATPTQPAHPATFPPKRIPMGPKGDCPVCH